MLGLTPRNLLKMSKFLIKDLILLTAREREYRHAAPVNLNKSAVCLENYVLTVEKQTISDFFFSQNLKIIAFSFTLAYIYKIRGYFILLLNCLENQGKTLN